MEGLGALFVVGLVIAGAVIALRGFDRVAGRSQQVQATKVAQVVNRDGPAPDERKCPFCAETIKREAKLCRFCKSDLSVES